MVVFNKYTFHPGGNMVIVGRNNTGKTDFVTKKIIQDLINNNDINFICIYTQSTKPVYLNKYTSVDLNNTPLMLTYKPVTFHNQYKQIEKQYSETKTQSLIIIDNPDFNFETSETFKNILVNGPKYGITLVVVIEDPNTIPSEYYKHFSKLITTKEPNNYSLENIYTTIVENMFPPNVNKNLDFYLFNTIHLYLEKDEYFMVTDKSIHYKLTIEYDYELAMLNQKLKEVSFN